MAPSIFEDIDSWPLLPHAKFCSNARKRVFFETLSKRFTIKQTQKLTRESPIDYCSIRVTLNDQGEIKLDNQAYIDKLVTEAGMTDCNTTKNPISKEMLKRAAEEQHDDILLADQ